MAEYIEREALIQHMQECKGDIAFNIIATGYAFAFIENAPAADVVEVVRCKDCKRCETLYPEKKIDEEPRAEHYCSLMRSPVSPNDFCSWGEYGAKMDGERRKE